MAERFAAARPSHRRWGARLLAGLLGLALAFVLAPLLGGAAPPLRAAERQLSLSAFQMSGTLARDGSLQVSETLTARFQGQWNGLQREIPLLARRPDGLELLGISLISVSDGAGHPYRVESSRNNDSLIWRIFVPGAQDASRTVVLRYRVRNAVRFFSNHDELYWNVSGNAWRIPIERVSARLRLPPGATGVRASVYTGPQGSKAREARLQIQPPEVSAVSTRPFQPGEGLTLAVGFDKGLITPRSPLQRLLHWWQGRLALLLPLVFAAVLGPLWWWLGRDQPLGPLPVVYEPPGNLPAAVLGSLVKENVEGVSLGATLVDLAVKGHLKIQSQPAALPWFGQPKTYRFTLLTGLPQWQNLPAHENYLLSRLFPQASVGDSVDTRELSESFYVYVPGFQALVRDAVMAQGLFRQWPGDVRSTVLTVGLLLLLLFFLLGSVLHPDLFLLQVQGHPLIAVVSLISTGALIILFAVIMPRRTPKGAVVMGQTLGFQEFLRRVDAPRFNMVIRTPELFERFLPYAMVAGLTQSWARAFAGIVQEPPRWYDSSDTEFDIDDFSSSLDDCCRTTSSSMLSSPSSSGDSSSGSSGGGSSGGGDGGGGGGGF